MKNRINANTFRKIPLKMFIDTLIEVYNSGVDYIDIVGKNNPARQGDILNIYVPDEYRAEDASEYNYEEEDKLDKEDKKPLSDQDINDLI